MVEPRTQLSQLLDEIAPYQEMVLQHPLYHQLTNADAIRWFMRSHVFAVWDNMLLLKTLQQRLTCVTIPWLPPSDAIAARLINEIILDEETEEISPGQYLSHVEFYIEAMEELGADTQAIRSLFKALSRSHALEIVLASPAFSHLSKATQLFILQTWKTCQGSTPGIVASFLLGREKIVTPLFKKILEQLLVLEQSTSLHCDKFKAYCQKHLCADEERHIPMGQALLERVCGSSPLAWEQAKKATISTLIARKRLWDDLSDEIIKHTPLAS